MKEHLGTYKIINGKQIVGLENLGEEHFEYKRYSKEEYKKFIEDSQDFFYKYIRGDSYCQQQSVQMGAFVHLGNCIVVKELDDGYEVISNGRSRCAVAKEYGLDILVCVNQK